MSTPGLCGRQATQGGAVVECAGAGRVARNSGGRRDRVVDRRQGGAPGRCGCVKKRRAAREGGGRGEKTAAEVLPMVQADMV